MERFSNEMATRPQPKNGGSSLTVTSPLSKSYGAKVAEIITMSRAGNPAQLSDEEFKFLVGQWVLVLADFVPEAKLNECYLHASRNRDNSFPLSATDMCAAWKIIREAERSMPAQGTHDWSRSREVCGKCNGTGTYLFVRRDEETGRDYTYGKQCYHEGFYG